MCRAGDSERVLAEFLVLEAGTMGLEKYLFETGVAADLTPFSTDRKCLFSCVCNVASAGLLVTFGCCLMFSLLLDRAKICRGLVVWWSSSRFISSKFMFLPPKSSGEETRDP